jgi:hypothetical protein
MSYKLNTVSDIVAVTCRLRKVEDYSVRVSRVSERVIVSIREAEVATITSYEIAHCFDKEQLVELIKNKLRAVQTPGLGLPMASPYTGAKGPSSAV